MLSVPVVVPPIPAYVTTPHPPAPVPLTALICGVRACPTRSLCPVPRVSTSPANLTLPCAGILPVVVEAPVVVPGVAVLVPDALTAPVPQPIALPASRRLAAFAPGMVVAAVNRAIRRPDG